MKTFKLEILDKLRDYLNQINYNSWIEKNTICVGRYKQGTNQYIKSAAAIIKYNDIFYRIRCIQKHKGKNILSYVLKLNNSQEKEIASEDFSPSQRYHSHQYKNGKKCDTHIKSTGRLEEIGHKFDKLMKSIK